MQVNVRLPDGSVMEVPAGTSVYEVAERIGPGLAKAAVAGEVDGVVVDQRFPIRSDVALRIITRKDPEALAVLRHSAAHLMAMAVKNLWPEVHLGFGPAVEDGFYYDFDVAEPFSLDDLAKIEKEMVRLVKEDLPYERYETSRDEAAKILDGMGEDLKVEHVGDIPVEEMSFYRNGEFQDLCEGPHVRSTGEIAALKLQKTSSAYWKGDASNRPMSRIYGTAFFSKKDLEEHLALLEERKKRDHRRLGAELDLFSFHDEAPGHAFWHEKGATLYRILLEYFDESHLKRGYRIVRTPMVMSEELWHRSGHWDHYKDNMFFVETEEGRVAVKPMNCPGHNLIYRTSLHSYRDLPLRMTEAGLVHRNEMSGVIGGLTRVRSFTIDDAHIYCTPEQMHEEIIGVIEHVFETYRAYGFSDFEVELSTRPEEGSIGSDGMWDRATVALEEALAAQGIEYRVSPGAGAFYGPKIDFHLTDSLNRKWQCGTIQVDFAMPERFDLSYIGPDGDRHRPVMLHRAIYGSVERFIAILIEHHAGRLPLWLSPVQVVVMSITDDHREYAEEVCGKLRDAGIRARLDVRNEKVGRKIRESTVEKIPYMLILGGKEVESGRVSVRDRSGDQGSSGLDEFMEKVRREDRERI